MFALVCVCVCLCVRVFCGSVLCVFSLLCVHGNTNEHRLDCCDRSSLNGQWNREKKRIIDTQLHLDGNDFYMIIPRHQRANFNCIRQLQLKVRSAVAHLCGQKKIYSCFHRALNFASWKCVGVLVVYYSRCCVDSCVWKQCVHRMCRSMVKIRITNHLKRMNVTHI